jgi:DNA-binding MarR family transcriptional regulator
MTARQLAMFAILCDEEGPHRVRTLAKRLNVSKPVITRIHGTLQKHGLVKRWANPDDLRDCQIIPTDEGRALRDAMKALAA